MLRGILGRLAGGRARGMGGPAVGGTRRPTTGTTTGANREIERGARSLFRGLAARRR